MTTPQPNLNALHQLVGTWTTEMTHPAMPGVVVHGTSRFEWLEGERFLIHRSRTDHPDFPDAIAIIGVTDHDRVDTPGSRTVGNANAGALHMHYYDSRGVSRVYDVDIDAASWRISRMAPGFSQRFTGAWADGGSTIAGRWQTNEDGAQWHDDLAITFRRTT